MIDTIEKFDKALKAKDATIMSKQAMNEAADKRHAKAIEELTREQKADHQEHLKNKWALEDVTLKFDCLEKTNIQLE